MRLARTAATLIGIAATILLTAGAATADGWSGDPLPTPASSMPDEGATVSDLFPAGLPAGAVQVDADTIAFDEGAVLLNLGPTALGDCPSNWVCLWQDSQYSGQMVQFQQCCQWQNLADYGFANRMSSWANNRDFDARWAFLPNGGGTVRCMDSHSSVSYVTDPYNDEAESIRILDTDTAC